MRAPEQITQLNRGALEASLEIAKISMDSAEKLARLHMNTMHEALDETLAQTKAMADARDPQDMSALRVNTLEHGMDHVFNYSRNIYEVAAKAQAEIGHILESRYSEFNREVGELVDEAARSAPPGAQPALAFVKQSMAAGNQLVDALSKVTRQVAETAEANVRSAADTAFSRAKSSGRHAAESAEANVRLATDSTVSAAKGAARKGR